MSSLDIRHRLNALISAHAGNFSPVRFAYISSLATRIESPDHKKNILLIEKFSKAIEQYEVDLAESRSKAKVMLTGIENDFPSHFEVSQEMFVECKFKQLEKLNVHLGQDKYRQDNPAVLSALKNSIKQPADKEPPSEAELSFEDLLKDQAQDVLGDNDTVAQDIGSESIVELRSMKVFRESIKHENIDRIIDRAINQCPENPGPHNPHMLAIKSLTQMQKLSPHYLRRFASYIETLLWLEKNSVKLSDVKK
jgi:hypothetical protein